MRMVPWGGVEGGDRKVEVAAGVEEGIWEAVFVVVAVSSAESCKKKGF